MGLWYKDADQLVVYKCKVSHSFDFQYSTFLYTKDYFTLIHKIRNVSQIPTSHKMSVIRKVALAGVCFAITP